MRRKEHIEQLRAEAIAKVLLLSSAPDMLIEESRSDFADFVVRIPDSQARVGVEVKMRCNLPREKQRLLSVTNSFAPYEGRLPVLLVVVDGAEVDGKLALLANWGEDGLLEISMDAKLLPYSPELVRKYMDEVAVRFEAMKKLAS